MKKTIKAAFIAAMTTAAVILNCVPVSATEIPETLYPLTGIVTEVNYEVEPEVDEVTMTCANGNRFSWYADSSDCWELYDLASCIMDSKGTAIVYDDEVLLAHYAGALEHFEEIQKGEER